MGPHRSASGDWIARIVGFVEDLRFAGRVPGGSRGIEGESRGIEGESNGGPYSLEKGCVWGGRPK